LKVFSTPSATLHGTVMSPWGEHYNADDRLAGEKIYYDRGTVLRQLGVYHEPPSVLGQICIFATHPITIVRLSRGS
jgi:hypothetical protein